MKSLDTQTLGRKRTAVAGLTVVAIAVGSMVAAVAVPIGSALAQEGESTTTIQPEATAPGPSTAASGLDSLFRHIEGGGLESVLDSLVEDGTITAQQSEAIAQRFASKAAEARAQFEEDHPLLAEAAKRLEGASKHWAERGDQVRAALGAELDELSAFLGIGVDELTARLATESLAEIAGDKTPELAAMLAEKANVRIDGAVASGKLSEERAAEVKEKTAARIERALEFVGGGNLREHVKDFLEGRGGR